MSATVEPTTTPTATPATMTSIDSIANEIYENKQIIESLTGRIDNLKGTIRNEKIRLDKMNAIKTEQSKIIQAYNLLKSINPDVFDNERNFISIHNNVLGHCCDLYHDYITMYEKLDVESLTKTISEHQESLNKLDDEKLNREAVIIGLNAKMRIELDNFKHTIDKYEKLISANMDDNQSEHECGCGCHCKECNSDACRPVALG